MSCGEGPLGGGGGGGGGGWDRVLVIVGGVGASDG